MASEKKAPAYPSVRYNRAGEKVVVESPEAEKELGEGWSDSPAAFGVETHPGSKPDPEIAKNAKKAK